MPRYIGCNLTAGGAAESSVWHEVHRKNPRASANSLAPVTANALLDSPGGNGGQPTAGSHRCIEELNHPAGPSAEAAPASSPLGAILLALQLIAEGKTTMLRKFRPVEAPGE